MNNKTANNDKKKEVSQKDIDIATQVLMELRKKEEQQPDDPYTQMAKKLKKRKGDLNSDEEVEVVEKKRPPTEDEIEMERLRRLESMASKLNEMPLKKYGKMLKIGVLVAFIIWSIYMNGFFEKSNDFQIIDTELWGEMFGWRNLIITLKESWFMFVAIAAYLLLKRYNDKLDQEDIKLMEEQIREEERK